MAFLYVFILTHRNDLWNGLMFAKQQISNLAKLSFLDSEAKKDLSVQGIYLAQIKMFFNFKIKC